MNVHGDSRFADSADLKKAGMLADDGLFLGVLSQNAVLKRVAPEKIYHNGEGHILTVGAVGSGKSAALVIPNLLNYTGSVVVTDPKGELAAVTADYRRDVLKHEVVILNPFRAEMAERLGVDLGDTSFNPLSMMARGNGAQDDARMIANILLPDSPNDKAFFQRSGRAVITGFLLYLVEFELDNLTLPRLMELLTLPPKQIQENLLKMIGSNNQTLKNYGGQIAGHLQSDEQWAGVLQTAEGILDSFGGDGALASHISTSAFNPRHLKERGISVYIVLPGEKREAYKTWLSLVMVMIGEAIGRSPVTGRRVVMICDEFANLGYVPSMLRAMAEYRGAGLKVWLLIQALSQLERNYGRGWKEFLEICDTKQFFKVQDFDTAKMASDFSGQTTQTVRSWRDETIQYHSMRQRLEEEHKEFHGFDPLPESYSYVGMPIIRPETVLQNPLPNQIIIRAGMPTIRAELVYYFQSRTFYERAKPNPYAAGKSAPQKFPYDNPAREARTGAVVLIGLLVVVFAVIAALWWR